VKPKHSPMNAGQVMRLLHELWPKNGYAILAEVGNATGSKTRRHADAVVMSLWPSRGMAIYGVEIKVSRSDWLAELSKPEKAEEVAQFCDGWYVAVAKAEIIAAGELPPGWGMIVCDGGKAKIVVPAPKLEAIAPTRGFVAAMLRRAAEWQVPEEWARERVEAASAEAQEAWKKYADAEVKRVREHLARLEASVQLFEQKTGVKIDGYDLEKLAPHFRKAMQAMRVTDHSLEHLADRLEAAAKVFREVRSELVAVEQKG